MFSHNFGHHINGNYISEVNNIPKQNGHRERFGLTRLCINYPAFSQKYVTSRPGVVHRIS